MSDGDSQSFFFHPHKSLFSAKLDPKEQGFDENNDLEGYQGLFENMSSADEDGVLFKPLKKETFSSDGILFQSGESTQEEEDLSKAFKYLNIESVDIFTAVKSGDFNIVYDLLTIRPEDANKKYRFRHKDVMGSVEIDIRPLMYAAHFNYLDIAKLLIFHKANINEEVEGWTALMFAAAQGNAEMVDFLVKCQADIHLANNDRKVNALMIAVSNGHDNVVDVLIKKDSSLLHVSHSDSKGRTVIHHALKRNYLAMAQKLMEMVLLKPFTPFPEEGKENVLQEKNTEMLSTKHLPDSSPIQSAFLQGVTFAFKSTLRTSKKGSPPIKPLISKADWLQLQKEQGLKDLLERAKKAQAK